MKQKCVAVWRIVTGLLRELADERAYERHLRAHGQTHSPEAWRAFCERRLRAKYLRAKCC
jgi:hypothetical protein